MTQLELDHLKVGDVVVHKDNPHMASVVLEIFAGRIILVRTFEMEFPSEWNVLSNVNEKPREPK